MYYHLDMNNFCFCHCNDTISCPCLGEAAWVRSVHLVAVSPELPPLVCHGEHAGLAWPCAAVHRGAGEHEGSRQVRKIKNEFPFKRGGRIKVRNGNFHSFLIISTLMASLREKLFILLHSAFLTMVNLANGALFWNFPFGHIVDISRSKTTHCFGKI